jgi:tRNA wybutosine-synthesizing protein 3
MKRNTKNSFNSYKQRNLLKLQEALEDHKVDTEVISLLERINTDERFVTTSSCSGRIVLLSLPRLGDKKQALFLGCWHHTPTTDDIKDAMKKYSMGQLWLLAQPPIFHIAARDINSATLMLSIGIEAGFKLSGIKTLQNQCLVELLSTERLDMPIGKDGIIYPDEVLLRFLLETAETVIIRSKEKLQRLDQKLRYYLKNEERD